MEWWRIMAKIACAVSWSGSLFRFLTGRQPPIPFWWWIGVMALLLLPYFFFIMKGRRVETPIRLRSSIVLMASMALTAATYFIQDPSIGSWVEFIGWSFLLGAIASGL